MRRFVALAALTLILIGCGSPKDPKVTQPRGSLSGGSISVNIGGLPSAPPDTGPTTGNLWIQPGAGTCAGGRSSTAITLAAAASPDRICGSMVQAYTAASAGDTVCFGAGTYDADDISNGDSAGQLEFTTKSNSNDVVFDGCGSASIDMADLEFDMRKVDNIKLSHLTFRSFYLRGCSSDITLDHIVAKGSLIRGADRVLLENSTMGFGDQTSFWTGRTNSATGCATDNNDPADDITISNVRWGDVWSATSDDHTDSIAIDYVTNFTVDKLEMTGCENACLIFGNGAGLSRGASDVSITNSAFVCCYDAFQCTGAACNEPGKNNVVFFMDNDPGPVYFAFNSVSSENGNFKVTDATGADTRSSDFVIDSNVFNGDMSGNCDAKPSITWRNNVSGTGSACTGTNKVATVGWVDAPVTCCADDWGWDGTYDLDLTGGSGALNYGNQSVFPSTDIDGNARSGGTVDAGAYEG